MNASAIVASACPITWSRPIRVFLHGTSPRAARPAFGYTRLRGKMKLSVSGKNWIAPIVIVVIVALMLWASHNGH
jgi:hypothetical protein